MQVGPAQDRQTVIIAEPSYESNLYPLCIVWTILPCITWLLPWVGHTGICDRQGTIFDFLGFQINSKEMAFGKPRKFVRLKNLHDLNQYEAALKQANREYSQQGHDLCCNNCHHHVARVLNILAYNGRTDWTQLSVGWLCLWESSYVAWWAPLHIYLPFAVICGLLVLLQAIPQLMLR